PDPPTGVASLPCAHCRVQGTRLLAATPHQRGPQPQGVATLDQTRENNFPDPNEITLVSPCPVFCNGVFSPHGKIPGIWPSCSRALLSAQSIPTHNVFFPPRGLSERSS